MRNTLAIARREITEYFTSPVAYVLLFVFMFLSGYFFYALTFSFNRMVVQTSMNPQFAPTLNINQHIIQPLFGTNSTILLFIIPMLTMGLLAKEKGSRTSELLLTAPITNSQLILGKYLSALAMLTLLLTLTLVYPLYLEYYGDPDWGPTLSGFLGIWLLAASFAAVGLLTSSLTKNQVVAVVLSFGALLIFWLIDFLADALGPQAAAVVSYLSILEHFDRMNQGIIDTQDIVFYLSIVIFCLLLSQTMIQSHRWRR